MVDGGGKPGTYIDYTAYQKPEGDAELDARLEAAREAYSNAVNDIIDKVATEFEDGPGAQFVVQDFAMFAVFLASVKMVELAGANPWRKNFLSAMKYLIKRTEREVPEMMIALARSIQGGRAFEDGPAGEA
jgi:hypothetical protein